MFFFGNFLFRSDISLFGGRGVTGKAQGLKKFYRPRAIFNIPAPLIQTRLTIYIFKLRYVYCRPGAVHLHQRPSKFFPRAYIGQTPMAKHRPAQKDCFTVLKQDVEAWRARNGHGKTVSEQPLHGDPPCQCMPSHVLSERRQYLTFHHLYIQ